MMLKTLIKKQYLECFRSYFVNPKTGKRRSKGGIIGMLSMFIGVMLFLCGCFFGLSFTIGGAMFDAGMGWLFYTLMGIASVVLGTFGSVFNTYATLYLPKDNELLLSMPIPPTKILMTRISLVFGLSLMYSGCVWLPASVYAWIFGGVTLRAAFFQILLLGVIALFVTVITCALGWAVALIASRIKHKSFVVVLASLVFFGAYYAVCFRMGSFLETMVHNLDAVASGVRNWLNVFCQVGLAADGSWSSMLIFTGLTLVLAAVCFWLLSVSFLKITMKTQTERKSSKTITVKKNSIPAALVKRELRRFVGSPTYMLNCGLGIALLPVMAVVILVKWGELDEVLQMARSILPWLDGMLPAFVLMIVGMLCGMDAISTPSVSLEGKTLWILQSLPVSGRMVLRAKLAVHIGLNLLPALLAVIVIELRLGLGALTVVLSSFVAVAMIWFFGAAGLVIGVLRPDFQWTSEASPIKQSLNVFLAFLLAFILPMLVTGGCYLCREWFSADVYLVLAAAVLGGISFGASRWLDTIGARKFEAM